MIIVIIGMSVLVAIIVVIAAIVLVVIIVVAIIIVNASARLPRLAGLPTVGTCNYRYTGI